MNIIIARVHCGVSNCYKMWRMIVYTILLVVCSLSGIQSRPLPPQGGKYIMKLLCIIFSILYYYSCIFVG